MQEIWCDYWITKKKKKRWNGDLFVDDIVLLAHFKNPLLKTFLIKLMIEGIKNEMTFIISKCATLGVKPKNFIPSRHYENPTFKLGKNHLPKTNQYTNLGILFNESLNLKSIIV